VFASIALGRESPSLRRFAALAIGSLGVVLVLVGAGNMSSRLDPLASILTLVGAVLYAVYVVLAEPVSRRMNSLTLAAFVCTGAALMFMAYGSVRGSLTLGMGGAGWGWTATVAVSSTVIALAAYLAGVERLGASRASILATLEPAIACILAFLVFGDRLTALQLLGGAFVVSAGLVLQLRPIRSRRRDAPAHTAAGAPAGSLAREPA
jgi:drug/metabolite transporter (DMT)-like permease